MPQWCESSDVELLLSGVSGANFDASVYPQAIEDARDTMITKFAGKYSTSTYDLWDADIADVPNTIGKICAKLAAASILEIYTEGNSIGDTTSKAGSFYKWSMDRINELKSDTSTLATGESDNTPVATANGVITTNKVATDRVFTKTSMGNL